MEQYKVNIVFFCLMLIVSVELLQAQEKDSANIVKDNIKKGLNLGCLPDLSYSSDVGFEYGGLINIYDYGDVKIYTRYKHSLFIELSRSTKESGINQIKYDSEFLIPKIRVSAEASLFTEQALNFYGFNGYQGIYNADFEDKSSPNYISEMYYRYRRTETRLIADFQGNITGRRLR
jgi:hypothetical protein